MSGVDAPGTEVGGREPRLDDRVLEILQTRGGRLAFNGLRRALGAHPESLARALKRLEREGAVDHQEGGYSLAISPSAAPSRQYVPETRSVASVQLPSGIPSDSVLGQLAGRWFGALRWVGVYDRTGDPWLVWSVGTSSHRVMLSVRAGNLRVLVEGNARTSATPPEVETAAWELLRHALDRLRPEAGAAGGVRTLRLDGGASPGVVGFAA